jgi:hypothetical protein
MKLLFYRNTHDETGKAKTISSEEEAVWQSQIHAGGFVAHQLDSKCGETFLELMNAVMSYEDLYSNEGNYTTDEIMAALLELIRVGLVRYEIVP